tara:strand:- start:67 stop:402 length:336 start_codon:yes stop_codon:yes gene_type:complete
MAQEKNKEYDMPLGSDGGNPTPNPDFVAEVERQKDLQNMPLGSDGGDPTPNPDFIKELDKMRKKAKRKESMRVAERMTMLDHLDLLDLKLTDFIRGPGVQGLLRHINEEGE